MTLKRYGILGPWAELAREFVLRARSRCGALWSQRRIECERGARLASSVRFRGAGRMIVREGAVVEADVEFVAREGAVIEVGPAARIGARSSLRAFEGQRLEIGPESVIEADVLIVSSAGVTTGRAALIGARTAIVCREPTGRGRFVIGHGSHLSTDNLVDTCSDVEIGDEVRTGPNCAFYTHKHTPKRSELIWDQPVTTSPIAIGNGVWIGHGCQLMPGVRIGDAAVVGAGSVVTKPVPREVVAVGTPARILREVS